MRRTFRWLLALLATLLLLVLLVVVAVGWLLASDSGNRTLFGQLQAHLPGFELARTEGNLADGMSLYGVRYHSPQLTLELEEVALAIGWNCLSEQRICIDRLAATDGTIEVTPAASAEDDVPTTEPAGPLVMPVPLSLGELALSEIRYRMPGVAVGLTRLSSAASMAGDTLSIHPTHIDGLRVALTQAGSPAAPSADPAPPTAAAPGMLPTVALPLAIELEQLTLADTGLDLYGTQEQLASLSLAAQWRGTDLQVEQLALEHAMANVSLHGSLQLQQDYPLQLKLDSRIKKALAPLQGQQLTASLDGSLSKLQLTLRGSRRVAATVTGELQPLAADLPFNLQAQWETLGWPLSGQPAYLSRDGRLQAQGSLADYRFTLTTLLSGETLPEASLDASGRGDLQQLRRLALTLDTLGGRATLDGRLNWRQGVQWQAALALQQINPGRHWPELDGRLSGELTTHGNLHDGWQAWLDKLDITGELAGYPLALQGTLASSQDNLLQTDGLLLRSGDNRVRLSGELAQQWDLLAEVDVNALQQTLPDAAGQITGELRFHGPREAPEVVAELALARMAWGSDIALDSASLNGTLSLPQGGTPDGQLQADLRGLTAPGSNIRRGRLTVNGSLAEHLISVDVSGDPLSARLRIAGGVDDNHWRGALASARLETPVSDWVLEEPVRVEADLASGVTQVALHCWRSNPTRLCLEKATPLGQQGSVTLALSRFDMAKIADFLPPELTWEGSVDAGINLAWKPSAPPYLSAHIESTPGRIHWAGTAAEEALTYQQIRLRLLLDTDEAQAELLLRSEQLGQLTLDAAMDPYDPQRRLNGTFRIEQVELSKLQPFAGPVQRLAGQIAGQGEIRGTLEQPLLNGQIRLTGGEVGGESLPLALTDVGMELALTGQQAELSGSLRSGQGQGTLSGQLDWRQMPLRAELSLQGQRLEVDHEYARLQVSPDINVRFADQQLDINGRVDVPWGRVEVAELPPSAVPVSDDVIIVEQQQQQQASRPLPVAINLQIRLGDNITLDAMGLEAAITGQMRLKQAPGQPMQGAGELFIREGNFRAYGQNLLIDEGRIVFSGPLDNPYVNVRAYRNPDVTEDGVIAGVQVQGNADGPRLTLYSTPAMNQAQQLSYLLRGRALDAGSGDGNMNAMLLGLGVGQVGGVVGKLGQAFGVEDLALDTTGAGDDTQVELKAYLLPDVQVSYGVGVFSAVQELTIRYQVLSGLYLEAVSSLESSVDLFYEFEFD